MKTNDGTQAPRPARAGSAVLTMALAGGILLLAGACRDEESVFERRYVLATIPGFETEDHIELLDHEDPNLRYLALANLLAMGALDEPEDDGETEDWSDKLQARLRELLEDPAAKVRAIASYAPINRSGPRAEERLVARLDDPHSAVRVEALASLGIEREPRVELSPAATDRVARLLDHGNALVRLHALETLGSSCSAERAESVVRRIASKLPGCETFEILKALETLGRIDAAEADTVLLARLDDDDERVVKVAARGLVGTKPKALEEWILDSLQEERWPEDFLIETLADVATARSREAVVSRLAHPDSEVRSGCRRSLVRIGDREALDALAGALDEMIPIVETKLESPPVEPPPEEELVAGLYELTELGEDLGIYQFDGKGIRALLQSPGRPEQLVAMVRLRAEEFIDGSILDDQSADAELFARLKTLAADRSPVTRAMAYESLGRSIQAKAGEILLEGIDDPVFQVRLRALDALVSLTRSTGRRTPLRAVYDRREEFTPETYAEDEPALILREGIEQAVRQFEPSWDSDRRAERDLREGRTEVARLMAASHLEPREDAVEALLDALATGSDGARTYALRLVGEHLDQDHLARLRHIAAGETDPDRKQALAELIAELEKPPE